MGWFFTADEMRMAHEACRSAVRFFKTYGKGKQPQTNRVMIADLDAYKNKNEYVEPMENKNLINQREAMRYTHRSELFLKQKAQEGALTTFKRSGHRLYVVEELDRYVKKGRKQ